MTCNLCGVTKGQAATIEFKHLTTTPRLRALPAERVSELPIGRGGPIRPRPDARASFEVSDGLWSQGTVKIEAVLCVVESG